VQEYNVNYVYVGSDELTHYPGCIGRFDEVSWLTQVYSEMPVRLPSRLGQKLTVKLGFEQCLVLLPDM